MCGKRCSSGETPETFTLTETRTHLPPWYQLPRARDEETLIYSAVYTAVAAYLTHPQQNERLGAAEFRPRRKTQERLGKKTGRMLKDWGVNCKWENCTPIHSHMTKILVFSRQHIIQFVVVNGG